MSISDQESPSYCLAIGRVYCSYCPGYCCYRLQGATLYLDATDINRIARHFGITDGEVRSLYLEGKNTFKVRADGSCVFLSNEKMKQRCSIHEARPKQCREFPYEKPCPYLERGDLLAEIQPRIEAGFTFCGENPGKEDPPASD
jgi:Fe-S-cluster containining protein